MPISSIWKRDFLFLGLWWEPLENNANIFSLKTGFQLFFLACDGNLWKIISISSIWKRNFRVFSGLFWKIMPVSSIWKRDFPFFGLWWEPLENNANIFYLKTGFPFFWACDGNLWKIMPISSIWKRDFLFLGLWWEPLENNANIFSLKTGFQLFFFGLWWQPLENNINIFYLKTEFPCFSGLVTGTSFENGISVSFWAFLENNANIFYLKTGFPFFWACDGTLWKIMPISSIWKRNFRVFSGLVMGTSFENGISVSFWAFLENHANIFYLKTGFPLLFLACDGNLWKIIPTSSIWKRNFRVFSGLVMGTSGK